MLKLNKEEEPFRKEIEYFVSLVKSENRSKFQKEMEKLGQPAIEYTDKYLSGDNPQETEEIKRYEIVLDFLYRNKGNLINIKQTKERNFGYQFDEN